MKYVKIPKEIRMGGQIIEIRRVERCDDNAVGETSICEGKIEIADVFDKTRKQSETSKENTFYHEVTHAILETMGEKDLSSNEKFVSCFAGFLADAMDKAYFQVEDEQTND